MLYRWPPNWSHSTEPYEFSSFSKIISIINFSIESNRYSTFSWAPSLCDRSAQARQVGAAAKWEEVENFNNKLAGFPFTWDQMLSRPSDPSEASFVPLVSNSRSAIIGQEHKFL